MVRPDAKELKALASLLTAGGAPPTNRREFLRVLGGTLVIGSLAPLLPGCEKNVIEPLTPGSVAPFLTPVADFFVQNGAEGSDPAWQMPSLDTATHRLTVDGLVATPRSFGLADLKNLAAGQEITLLKTLQCVFDAPLLAGITGLTGNALWTGIPLNRVLDACGGPTSGALRLRFHGADAFGNNLRLDRLTAAAPELLPPLIVYEMNGQPLTRAHGAPFRLIVNETFGYKNVKWLSRVEATDSDAPFGTYQDNGFFDDGTLAVNARATQPLTGGHLAAGPVEISGFALAGGGAISNVEVRVDDGAWKAAALVGPEAIVAAEGIDWNRLEQARRSLAFPWRGVWVGWTLTWDAPPGPHVLAIRATDTAGNVQPAVDDSPFDGTNPIPILTVTVA